MASSLALYALSENYQGEYVLDEQNSYGYDRTNIEPNRQYAAARFFPSKYSDDPFLGEVLITARFGVKFNDASRKLEYISYDVNIEHLIDPSGLIEASEPLYHGRSFIVE
uniref:Uncharacterized protein n=1 Tax=Caenorhabditis japonica TaxID=281687 RepID=A0A8R1IXP8_CAEJA